MSHGICSAGHFPTTIGGLPYWSALGSFRRSVMLSPVTLPTTTTAVSTELIIYVAVQ